MRKPAFGIIFATVFIDLVGFGMIVPLIGLYGNNLGVSGAKLGLLGMAFPLMGFLAAPVWGRLSDRLGRRPVLLASLAGNVASYVLYALSGSYAALLASRLLAGAFSGNIAAAQAYIADVTTGEDRARGMGLVGAAFGLGFIFGPPIGGLAAAHWGLAAPGWLAAFASALAFAFALAALPESLTAAHRALTPTRHGLPAPLDLGRLRRALEHPWLWGLLALAFGATFAFSNWEQTFSLTFQQRFGLDALASAAKAGWVLTFLGVLVAVVQGALIHPLTRRFGERRLMTAGLAIQSFGMFCIPFIDSYRGFFAVMVPIALGSGLINPSLSSLISKGAGAHEQGGALGLYQGLSSLARAIAPFIGLVLFARHHDLPMILGGTIMAGLFLFSLWLIRRATPDNA